MVLVAICEIFLWRCIITWNHNFSSYTILKLFLITKHSSLVSPKSCLKNTNRGLVVVHKQRWQVFGFFWPPTSLCWQFLPYKSWSFWTTYPPQRSLWTTPYNGSSRVYVKVKKVKFYNPFGGEKVTNTYYMCVTSVSNCKGFLSDMYGQYGWETCDDRIKEVLFCHHHFKTYHTVALP